MGIFNFFKKKDGLIKRWYPNGQLEYEYNYKDGKRDGLAKGWYPNGQLEYEYTYKDGELDGLTKSWDEDGQLQLETHHKDGKQAHLRGSEVSALKAEEKAETITPLIAYCSSVAIALAYLSFRGGFSADIYIIADVFGVLLLPAFIAIIITLFSTIKFHTAFFWVAVIFIPLSALGHLSAMNEALYREGLK